MGISFSYDHPTKGAQVLNIRLDPYSVNWTYSLNTSVVDTYGGQVIQVLSVKIDSLTITGQLGREGAWGKKSVPAGFKDRTGFVHPSSGIAPIDPSEQWDGNANTGPYSVGLTQMTEFFRSYFAISSQGADAQIKGHYLQVPMSLVYNERTWPRITPTQFPSYRRANDNFAPEWQVQAQVVEAPLDLVENIKSTALQRLNKVILAGDRVTRNPFSDPLVNNDAAERLNDQLVNKFKALLPTFTSGQIDDMIWKDITVPHFTQNLPVPAITSSDQDDYLDGEIGDNGLIIAPGHKPLQ